MNLIQPLLVVSLFLIGMLYLRRFRNRIFDRMIISIILLTGIVFVCFPELTSQIAHTVGVGRGTDFILYVSIVSVCFFLMVFYAKIRQMSQTITRLVREDSIRQAKKGGQANQ